MVTLSNVAPAIVDQVNSDLNKVQFGLLTQSDQIAEASHQLDKLSSFQSLSSELTKLQVMHQELQQKMYDTTTDNKKLKAELKRVTEQHQDQRYLT